MKASADLLERTAAALADKDVWFFSSGPVGEGDPVDLLDGWRFPDNLKTQADQVGPHDIAVFSGRLDMKALNFGEKMMMRAMRAPQGDFRDWAAIEAWANEIAAALQG